MRIGLDTNFMLYAEGVNDPARQAVATAMLDQRIGIEFVVPAQALLELFNVMVRKFRIDRHEARRRVEVWQKGHILAPTSDQVLEEALSLASAHQLQIWDAVILAASANLGAELLLSEDMHHGFIWRSTTVVNPFRTAH